MPSLAMVFERCEDGTLMGTAPWTKDVVTGSTWEEVYWGLMDRRRHG